MAPCESRVGLDFVDDTARGARCGKWIAVGIRVQLPCAECSRQLDGDARASVDDHEYGADRSAVSAHSVPGMERCPRSRSRNTAAVLAFEQLEQHGVSGDQWS